MRPVSRTGHALAIPEGIAPQAAPAYRVGAADVAGRNDTTRLEGGRLRLSLLHGLIL